MMFQKLKLKKFNLLKLNFSREEKAGVISEGKSICSMLVGCQQRRHHSTLKRIDMELRSFLLASHQGIF